MLLYWALSYIIFILKTKTSKFTQKLHILTKFWAFHVILWLKFQTQYLFILNKQQNLSYFYFGQIKKINSLNYKIGILCVSLSVLDTLFIKTEKKCNNTDFCWKLTRMHITLFLFFKFFIHTYVFFYIVFFFFFYLAEHLHWLRNDVSCNVSVIVSFYIEHFETFYYAMRKCMCLYIIIALWWPPY